MQPVLAAILVLVIIFVVPIAVYGLFTAVGMLEEPRGSGRFLFGVLVQKVGTAITFVAIFYLTRNYFGEHWLLYAGLCTLMFVINEIGRAIAPDYSTTEAVAGIISEVIYFPASAWVVAWLLT